MTSLGLTDGRSSLKGNIEHILENSVVGGGDDDDSNRFSLRSTESTHHFTVVSISAEKDVSIHNNPEHFGCDVNKTRTGHCFVVNSEHPTLPASAPKTNNHLHPMEGKSGNGLHEKSTDASSSHDNPRLYRRRWIILAIFCSLSMSNAFQWIQYAIITSIITKFYGVSELAVNWTSMIYMLAYIPLVFPATYLLDRYGLRLSAILGAVGNCMGACLKCLACKPDKFLLLFVGQTISGASQIFTLGLPARIAAIWFGPQEVSTATSIGVFGNQLGIALGCLLPPILVTSMEYVVRRELGVDYAEESANLTQDADDRLASIFKRDAANDLQNMSYGLAAITLCILVLVLLFFRKKPSVPPSYAQLRAMQSSMEKNYFHSLKILCSNKNFVLLIISYGINTGAFYAVSTLLNQVLLNHYPGEEINIGRIGLLIVLAGLIGSVSLGFLLDRTKAYKSTTVIVYALSMAGMVLYTFTIGLKLLWVVFVVSGFLGFFMTGYLALGFEFASELTHPASEGTSSGLLNVAAQVFGITMTLGLGELLINTSPFICNITLSVCLLVGLIVTAMIKADLRRQEAERRKNTIQYAENGDSANFSAAIDSDTFSKL